ncbi:RICIN domain-containing protein [Mucilaginibacter hurinus]|nr:RICIN domain-containing protein [Mucilaginibacter hurinus]
MKSNKIKSILIAATALLIIQGCKKTEPVISAENEVVTTIEKSSGLQTFAATGEHGTYQFIAKENNKSGQIPNFALNNYATAGVGDFSGTAHQKFRLTYMGNNLFKIMNLGSGKVLQSVKYEDTQVLVQNSENGSSSQLWEITPVGNKTYRAINKASGLAITSNGAGVAQLTPYTGRSAQLWGYNRLAPDAYRDDQVVNFFHRTLPSQGSVAFDQGSSIPLPDGRVLWVTEDAYDGSRLTPNGNLKCGFFQYNNSILIQPSKTDWNPDNTPNMTIANSRHNRPRQIVDNQPGTDVSWPGVGIEVNGFVYMHNAEIKFGGATKQSIIKLKVNPPGQNQWEVERTLIKGVSDQTDISWITGMNKPGDGYVYVFGCKGVFFNANNIYVARFAESDPATWTFWNGTAWAATPNSSQAARVGTSQSNVAIGYSKGKYIMMQLDLGYFCDPNPHSIYLSTSSSPTGPFTAPVKVFSIEDRYRGHLNRYYTPMVHPEFDNGKNELLLTYSVNYGAGCAGVSDNACENNEQPSIHYQVKGVRVPYSMIGM